MRKRRELVACTLTIALVVCLQSVHGLPTPFELGRHRGVRDQERSTTHDQNVQQALPNNVEAAGSVVVSTPQGLRDALERAEITSIAIEQDLALRWYNGWDGGSVFMGNVIFRNTNVSISSAHAKERVELDVGGMQLLGSLLVLSDGITMTLNRLVLKNVMPIQKEALEQDVGDSHIVLVDSIVHIQATKAFLSDIASVPSLQAVHSGDDQNSGIVAFKPGTCQMHDRDIDCPAGGWYGRSFRQAIGWGGSEGDGSSGSFELMESFVAMEKLQMSFAQNPAEFHKLLRDDHQKTIFVNPPVNTMDMAKTGSCSPQHPTTALDHDLILDGRMGSIKAIFLGFHQMKNCMSVGNDVTLHIRDIVIDESTTQGEFNNFIPFFKMSKNSRIKLEAVVISVIPTDPHYKLKDIERELRSVAIGGADLNISEASLDSFYMGQSYMANSFRNPDTSGLILEKGSIRGSSQVEGTVDLIHSFFIIDDSFFPEDHAHPSKSSRLSVWVVSSIVCSIALVLAMGLALAGFKRKRGAAHRAGLYKALSTSIFGESGGGGSCATDEEELTTLSRSPADVGVDQEHQLVVDNLMKGLTLGNLIGRGSFGQVYRATWNGAVVAVKVIFHRQSVVSADKDIEREATLSSDLRHPNVVQTFMQFTVAKPMETGPLPQPQQKPNRGDDDNPYLAIHDAIDESSHSTKLQMVPMQTKETWLVQEYCDLGSLGHSLERKLMDRGGHVDMGAVLATCCDIARGMQYLHSQNVIHGDLKCTNVLLCSSVQDRRGLFAKVADFGLSRRMDVDVTHISTNTVGTLTHMPPELLKGRKLVPKGDVYSFGIMMWEIVMGKSPFEGWTAPQLLRAVLNQGWRPTFPTSVPYGYSQLGSQCLSENPVDRPSFEEVLRQLEKLRELEGGAA